ncbi:pro-sigmaK processing inhibitor BofA family protein [Alicyclobacillus sacchari]|uniref:pro-sigmaK processing inhibitor BofA family protein n=1 Tax=Alicyclobacillus sacchari TaxID=392010 RepID=UPI001066BC91|nr:pro-sigmaK processing inhibitor BofA family protein [Alicyclobacillus sacchari]
MQVHISSVWLWGGAIVLGVLIVSQFFQQPGRAAWRIVRNVALGCLFVFAVDWIGSYLHFHVPFNPVTALTAGILGVPGVAALVAMKLWIFA